MDSIKCVMCYEEEGHVFYEIHLYFNKIDDIFTCI